MGVLDMLAAVGDPETMMKNIIQSIIDKNKHLFEQVPAFLAQWEGYLKEIHDDAKIARNNSELILAALDPGRVTPELTAAAAAAAADDPRNYNSVLDGAASLKDIKNVG